MKREGRVVEPPKKGGGVCVQAAHIMQRNQFAMTAYTTEKGASMTRKVVVAGVGMVPFTKPGASETYDLMGAQAARLALADARVEYQAIQQAYAGFVYGDSTA